MAWAFDNANGTSAPAGPVWVDFKGAAPTAGFYYDASSREVYFYDQSSDADFDDEIVARRWEFGDGAVMTGNEFFTSHTYAAGGTYDVRLTVTDSFGLTGTTTRSVTVPPDDPPPTE
jgi:PKD repeat protein